MKSELALADALIKKYGLLLTLNDVAQELKRSTESLRQSLHDRQMIGLKNCKKKIGRRVYFIAHDFAEFCDGASS